MSYKPISASECKNELERLDKWGHAGDYRDLCLALVEALEFYEGVGQVESEDSDAHSSLFEMRLARLESRILALEMRPSTPTQFVAVPHHTVTYDTTAQPSDPNPRVGTIDHLSRWPSTTSSLAHQMSDEVVAASRNTR